MRPAFSDKVLNWFDEHGRKDLPWQHEINPYRVWVSEIMLQQTQVKTVIPYYQRFMASFPDVDTLASATQDEVLKHWSGLGYYARGRNLHKAAQRVCEQFNGRFPDNLEDLQNLPGIGRSTAAAILSIAHNQPQAILDGNVKRVLARCFAVEGWPGKAAVLKQLWALAEKLTPTSRNGAYTQAIMDLGATVCTRSKPFCKSCPLSADCMAFAKGRMTNYPASKPKKTLPQKQTVMLLVQNCNKEVLMLKRPPAGIWGGLWCFPQFENNREANDWLLEQHRVELQQATKLDTIHHVFSHFKLEIKPYLVLNSDHPSPLKSSEKLSVMEATELLWYNLNTELNGGLATPVKTLLSQLTENQIKD